MRVLFILLAVLATADAERYTKYALRHATNDGNMFFDAATYGGDVHPEPGVPLTRNRDFRAVVNARLPCDGAYCVGGAFACAATGSTMCYHVEHIIDVNGADPRFPPQCKRCKLVPGNMIMAAGPWNTAVGGLAGSNYAAAQSEKTSVYGEAIMSRAAAYVAACCAELHVLLDAPDNWAPPEPMLHRVMASGWNPVGNMPLTLIFVGDISNYTEYDAACDDADECNCDSDSDCGCDCDYDVVAPGASNAKIMVMLAFALGLLSVIIVCACYDCCRARHRLAYAQIAELSASAPKS